VSYKNNLAKHEWNKTPRLYLCFKKKKGKKHRIDNNNKNTPV
jgi:hypothetical protein